MSSKKTAEIIERHIKDLGSNNFVGHIGGDDFFATIKESYEVIQETCEKIIKEFDEEKLITSLSVAGYFGSITRFETAENFGTYMAVSKSVSSK